MWSEYKLLEVISVAILPCFHFAPLVMQHCKNKKEKYKKYPSMFSHYNIHTVYKLGQSFVFRYALPITNNATINTSAINPSVVVVIVLVQLWNHTQLV